MSAEDVEALTKLVGERFAQELVEQYKSFLSITPEQKPQVITSDPIEDKSARGPIHQEVRRIFQSKIDTSTAASGAITAQLVLPRKGKKRGRGGGGGGRGPQEKPAGEYLHFTLVKDNRDTMDAVNQISRILRAKPQSIGYAGTKDRRATTAQRCSVRYTNQRSLAGINGKLWGIVTGDYEYKNTPIHLGQLLGNEFAIVLKHCQILEDNTTTTIDEKVALLQKNVGASLDHMAQHGWINYFGHQRFGTHQIGTHDIGKLILADKFEEAVNSLLDYDPEIAQQAEEGKLPEDIAKKDDSIRQHACMLFRTGRDIKRAIELMPRRFGAETCVLRHLTRGGASSMQDYVGALTHITRGLRSMYMHAYQSYVWNHAASKRWDEHGNKVIAGDLVIAETEATPLIAGQDQDGDDIINPVEDDDEAPVRARPLSEEEVSSGRYTINDIVLPTPGYEVVYPANAIGKYYEELMAADGLDPHSMQRRRREFSLPGRYRKLMNRFLGTPSIEFKTYVDDTEQMHPTDVDRIRAAKEDDGREAKRAKTETDTEEANGKEADLTPKIAAVVKFQLGRSAYATVTLRELMGDTLESDN
mgnify:CR=1 FL=1